MSIQNYRGIKPANLIKVLEGNGTPEKPYTLVQYVVTYEDVQGIIRLVTIGKVVDLTEKEKNFFNDFPFSYETEQ